MHGNAHGEHRRYAFECKLEASVTETSAGGCYPNNASWPDNLQFRLWCYGGAETIDVVIALMQRNGCPSGQQPAAAGKGGATKKNGSIHRVCVGGVLLGRRGGRADGGWGIDVANLACGARARGLRVAHSRGVRVQHPADMRAGDELAGAAGRRRLPGGADGL